MDGVIKSYRSRFSRLLLGALTGLAPPPDRLPEERVGAAREDRGAGGLLTRLADRLPYTLLDPADATRTRARHFRRVVRDFTRAWPQPAE